MASLKSKQSLLLSKLPVVQVVGGHPSPLPNAENSIEAIDRAMALLESALGPRSGATIESVLNDLTRGTRRLWLSDTSAAVTEMLTFPSGLKVMSVWLAAGNVKELLSWLPLAEEWGRLHGATQARINGRSGWERLTGYKELRRVLVKDLGHV
jgi:hypothetical protein